MGVQKSKKSKCLTKKKRSFLTIKKKILINKKLLNWNSFQKINIFKLVLKKK